MDYFNYSDKDLYEIMKQEGDKRFGSECKHEKTKNSICINCFRKVITNQKRDYRSLK